MQTSISGKILIIIRITATDVYIDWLDAASHAGSGWHTASHTIMLRKDGAVNGSPIVVSDSATNEAQQLVIPLTLLDADNTWIEGTVTGNGSPLSGVDVLVKLNNVLKGATITDASGKYVVGVPAESGYSVMASMADTDWSVGMSNNIDVSQGWAATGVDFDLQSCGYALSRNAFTVNASGATKSVDIASADACAWAAAANVSWITVQTASGTGSGTFSFVVAENTSASSRSGRIVTSAGDITVNQLAAGSASITDNTWLGGVAENWETAANWAGNSVPGAGEDVSFYAIPADYLTLYMNEGHSVGRMNFNSDAVKSVALYGYPLSMTGDAVMNVATGNHEIASTLQFAPSSNAVVAISDQASMEWRGMVSGTNLTGKSLVKSGKGTLSLSSTSNDVSFDTWNINEGCVELVRPYGSMVSPFGSATSLVLGADTELRTTLSSSLALSPAMSVVGAATINITTNSVTLNGAISGDGSMVKKGEGSLTLSGASPSYTGALTVEEGTLCLAANIAAKSITVDEDSECYTSSDPTIDLGSSGSFTLSDGAWLSPSDDDMAGALTFAGEAGGALNLNGGVLMNVMPPTESPNCDTLDAGNLTITMGSNSVLDLGYVNMSTATVASTYVLATNWNKDATFANVQGLTSHQLVYTNNCMVLQPIPTTLVEEDGEVNNVEDAVFVASNVVGTVTNSGEMGLGSLGLAGGGRLEFTGGSLSLTNAGVTVQGGGQLVIHIPITITFGQGSFVGAGSTFTIMGRIIIGGVGSRATYTGIAYTKEGEGMEIWGATNNFGAIGQRIALEDGTLRILRPEALGVNTNPLTINNGAVLETANGSYALYNAIELLGNGVIAPTNSSTLTLAGALEGTNAVTLTKRDNSTLVIENGSAFKGSINVENGTLVITNTALDLVNLTVASGKTLILDASQTLTADSMSVAGATLELVNVQTGADRITVIKTDATRAASFDSVTGVPTDYILRSTSTGLELVLRSSEISLDSTSASYTRDGGAGSFNVQAPSDVNWTETKTNEWITLTTTSGTGSNAVNYSVAAYAGQVTRTGSITVSTNIFTVTQTGDTAPAITITTDGDTVPYATASYTISGTSKNLSGDMMWSNQLSGAKGTFTSAESWTKSIALVVGDNTITVSGSNAEGSTSANVSIIREDQDPILTVSSTTLRFNTETLGQLTNSFTVSNTGGKTLTYTVTNPTNAWFTSCLPDNGSLTNNQSESETVIIDTTGMTNGTYTADLTISGNGQEKTVTLKAIIGKVRGSISAILSILLSE
ncbi:MAG: hypothetical protein EOL87_14615 [Spartobacteria bacterium]|nr:hypothetical protein [Spartobacteria bacterium]